MHLSMFERGPGQGFRLESGGSSLDSLDLSMFVWICELWMSSNRKGVDFKAGVTPLSDPNLSLPREMVLV